VFRQLTGEEQTKVIATAATAAGHPWSVEELHERVMAAVEA
jgi:hypothetical protein